MRSCGRRLASPARWGLLLAASALVVSACGLFPREHSYYRSQREDPSIQVEKEPRPAVGEATADAQASPPKPEETPRKPEVNPRKPELAGVLPKPMLESASAKGRWRALLIGISDYTDTQGYAPDLVTPAEDVGRLQEVLEKNYGFDEVQLLLDQQASRRRILRALRRLHTDGNPDDNILVYFAGHGILRADGAGIWVASDSLVEEDGIPNADIKQRLASLPARRVLLVSDSCFSGSFLRKRSLIFVPEMVSDATRSRFVSMTLVRNLNASREVISSGNVSPVPDEGIGFCRGMSPFACQLMTALEEVPMGAAVSTTDLFVELYSNVQRQSSLTAAQRPQRGTIDGHAGGEFYLIRKK
jgi:hypothetical protein